MRLRLLPILFSVLISSVSLFGQCPPPGFPEPGNNCPDAPILCENLDGYCATINNNNQTRPFPCCNGGWTLNNDEWFAFFAGTTTITIEIVPQNCTDDEPLKGLQGGIYDGCPLSGCNAMDVQCECTETPFILTSGSYVVGEVYWIVLDGCNGNICDYTVHVLEGSTVGFAPADPGVITGPNAVCHGSSSGYTVAAVNGATTYNWALIPANAGTLIPDHDSVTVSWADTFSGIAKLCLSTSNQCYTNGNETCYDIEVQGNVVRSDSISFCPGDSVTINGQVYNQSAMVVDTITSPAGCDTIIIHVLSLLPYPTRTESISLCPGESVTIGGQVYNQPGTVIDTIPALMGCDTIATYTLTLLSNPTRAESISLCPGESVSIGGQVYNQPGTVIDTIPAFMGCDTIVTYTLTLLSNPTRAESISLCPGESVTIGGQVYNQPGTVLDTIPALMGCDTIVTYTLEFLTPAPSNVNIVCPPPVTITQSNTSGTPVNYTLPTATTDCTCPGILLALTNGPASGSNFPLGLSSVCFTARDSCGQTASCCFNVTVEAADMACDTKENGCLKYELLSITEDVHKNRTYRIRLTNNCSNRLISIAFQLPNGMTAIEPANLSTYTAPSGNTYLVRNPNFTPQYSIRYSSISDSIHLGESDIFKYTLPAQANVTFINVTSRLEPNIYQSAHLNTFNCPIGMTPNGNRPIEGRDEETEMPHKDGRSNDQARRLLFFPNPANQLVRVETGGPGELILQQALGSVMLRQTVENRNAEFSVASLPQGLYQVIFITENGILHGSLVVHH